MQHPFRASGNYSPERVRKAPQKMGNVVAQLLAKRGYAQQQDGEDCAAAWREAAGEKLSGQTRVGLVKYGVLEIFVKNSSTIQELTFNKKRLLAEMKRLLPQQKLREIKFKLGAAD